MRRLHAQWQCGSGRLFVSVQVNWSLGSVGCFLCPLIKIGTYRDRNKRCSSLYVVLGDMHVWCGATCRICSREYTSNVAGPFLSARWEGGSHILGAYCDLDTVQLDSNRDPRIRMTSIQLFFRGSPLWALSDKSYQRRDRSLRRPQAPVTDQTNAEFLSFKLRHYSHSQLEAV